MTEGEEARRLLYRRLDSVCSEFNADMVVDVCVSLLGKEIVHQSKPTNRTHYIVLFYTMLVEAVKRYEQVLLEKADEEARRHGDC